VNSRCFVYSAHMHGK